MWLGACCTLVPPLADRRSGAGPGILPARLCQRPRGHPPDEGRRASGAGAGRQRGDAAGPRAAAPLGAAAAGGSRPAAASAAPRWPCGVVLLLGSQALLYDAPGGEAADSEEEAELAAERSSQWMHSHTGGFLANQALARYCAARCRHCDLVVLEGPGEEMRHSHWEGWPVLRAGPEALRKWLQGRTWDVAIASTLRPRFLELIQEFGARCRAGLAHDYNVLPFGPWSDPRFGLPADVQPLDDEGMRSWSSAVGALDAVLCTSEALRRYVEEHAPRPGLARLCYCADYHFFGDPWRPLAEGAGTPLQAQGGCEAFVTMISPCAAKGLAVFLAVVDAMPDVPFLAVQTRWTKSIHASEMRKRPNLRVVPAVPCVDGLYARTRVLLVPSLWPEGFGLVALEACLRGIPVVSTTSGGLPEANTCGLCFEAAAVYDAAAGELRRPASLASEAARLVPERGAGGRAPRPGPAGSGGSESHADACIRLVQQHTQVLPGDVAPVPEFVATVRRLLTDDAFWHESSERGREGARALVEGRRDALGRFLAGAAAEGRT